MQLLTCGNAHDYAHIHYKHDYTHAHDHTCTIPDYTHNYTHTCTYTAGRALRRSHLVQPSAPGRTIPIQAIPYQSLSDLVLKPRNNPATQLQGLLSKDVKSPQTCPG